MSNEKPGGEATTLLSSRLYTEASEKVATETEKEKKVVDPTAEEAAAAIQEAEIARFEDDGGAT